MRIALTMCLALMLGSGCSSDDGGPSETMDLTGHWCGAEVATSAECLGDEVFYLELQQSADDTVTGQACEAYGADECYAVGNGKLNNTNFTFDYTFSGFTVTGSFSVKTRGRLEGMLHSTKCGCDIPKTIYRVD
ncbi:MAG: hypothetical protein QM756_05890 [Polyangiaceae bacterium]